MAALASFLRLALNEGRLHLRDAPSTLSAVDAEARAVLTSAYRILAGSVADAPVFDADVALAASRVLYSASWYLLQSGETLDVALLTMPRMPTTAAHHLSADLAFRFLPTLYRRARAVGPSDPLAETLATLLRQWPLSGVRSDVSDGPLSPVDFANHAGLQMLYAERLARHEKPAWFPLPGQRGHVELVWHELGRDASRLPLPLSSLAVEDASA